MRMRLPTAVLLTALLGTDRLHIGEAVADDFLGPVKYPLPPPGEDVLARTLAALELRRTFSAVHAGVEEAAGGLAPSSSDTSSEIALVNLTVPWYKPPTEGSYELHLMTMSLPLDPQASLEEVVASLMMRETGAAGYIGLQCSMVSPPPTNLNEHLPTSSPQRTRPQKG